MITASQPQYPSRLLRCCSTRGSYVFSEVLPLTRSNSEMMSAMRLIAAAILSGLIVGCSGTTANAPRATPLATSTAATSAAPTSSASATQSTTNATLACTAPATALVDITEGPYYKANPPQNATLRTAGVAGTPLTLTGYVVSKSCQPIANAKLDFWQADGNGNYDNSGYTLR